MSENVEVLRRWFTEVWCEHRSESIDELMGADAVLHGIGPEPMGREAFKRFHAFLCNEVPDLSIEVEQVFGQGDWVAFHARASGTHASTGRTVSFQGSGMGRLEGGLIAEGYNSWDFLGYLIQIGVVPESAAQALGG